MSGGGELLFRSWHRGTRKWIWSWAASPMPALGRLSDAELGDFERLIDGRGPELYDWVTGTAGRARALRHRPAAAHARFPTPYAGGEIAVDEIPGRTACAERR